ncbi:hypothetical protein [Rubrivirga sp. IMCC45206]|uniref:hypothetical protein n=1 Tax=Rubrivirga sp. IMCC45206 TaxID=3391614 RepID=UPI00398FBB59
MTDAPRSNPMQGGSYAVLALFFLVVGVRDMTATPPDALAAGWELAFAAANALFFWTFRGAPPWVKPAAVGLFVLGLAGAISSFVL